MTTGVMKSLVELGLQCPQDVALATFDDMPVTELYRPPLTAVAQPAYLIGHVGAEMLINRIESKITGRTPIAVRLPTQLKIRESTIGNKVREGN